MSVNPPRVFISYSHDSASHKEWVLKFASTVRKRGADVYLDQWDLKLGDDLPHFMEKHLRESDFVLVVCTPTYVNKANSGSGGVGYEKGILSASMMKDVNLNKVIPILRGTSSNSIPTFLSSKAYIDFSSDKNDEIEYRLDELMRALLGVPLYVKPEIGESNFDDLSSSNTEPAADGIRDVMTVISNCYDKADVEYVGYRAVRVASKMPRLTMDRYIQQCRDLGYLRKTEVGPNVTITAEGIKYLEDQGIIS